LFAVLALRANRVVSKQGLIEAVWGLTTPPTVESSIYTYIARLRHELEPLRARWAPSKLIGFNGSGYELRLDPHQLDVQTFGESVEQARHMRLAGEPAKAVEWLDRAIALWRGTTALDGAVGPFAEAERARLGEMHFASVEDRIGLLIALNRHKDVIGELVGLVLKYPLRERLRLLLMVAYHRCGRTVDALEEFRDLRQRMVKDLGIEPGDDVQRYHLQMLRGDARELPTVEVSPPFHL
jgi:DNA-binding SARP family transcriptional activator